MENENIDKIIEYAGAGKRFLAFLLDLVFLYLLILIIGFIYGAILGGILGASGFSSHIESAINYSYWPVSLIIFFLYLYFSYKSASRATWGEKILGIKVSDYNGKVPTAKQVWLKSIGTFLTLIIFSPASILMLFDSEKRTPADKLAQTVVIKS